MINNVQDILSLTDEQAIDLFLDEIKINIRGVYSWDVIDILSTKFNADYIVSRIGGRYCVTFKKNGVTSKPLPGSHTAETLGAAFRVAFLRWWYQL
jgi:hypothetical protein